MLESLSLRRKFALPVVVSGIALLLVLGFTLVASRNVAARLDELERGHYPAVLFSRELRAALETIQLTLRDAVATEDASAIDATNALRDAVLERVERERANPTLDPKELDQLAADLAAYHALAVASSREMLAGDFTLEVTARLEELRRRRAALTASLEARSESADAEMRGLLASVRRRHAWLTAATGALLLLAAGVIAWLGRAITRDALEQLGALQRAAADVAAGRLAEAEGRASARRRDEFGAVLDGFTRMRQDLRGLVIQTRSAAGGVSDTSARLVEIRNEVRASSEEQALAAASIERALRTVTAGVGSVRTGLHQLSEFATTTSTSMRELDATLAETDAAVDGNAPAVRRASEATLTLASTTNQVEANAAELRASAESAERSIATWIEASRDVEARAGETLALAKLVDSRSLDGNQKARQAGESMSAIQSSFEEVSSSVARLVQRASSVGEINNVIEGIADETSLLALNAAIVSAQAGEQGRAFAVVSDAIRELANRTAESTGEIRKTLEDLKRDASLAMARVEANSTAVAQGSSLSSEVAGALDEIGENAKQCLENMTRVGESARRQEEVREQVREAFARVRSVVSELDRGAASQAAASQQVRSATDAVVSFMDQIRRSASNQRTESRSITAGAEALRGQIEAMVTAIEEQAASGQEILRSLETFRGVRDQSETLEKAIADRVQDLSARASELTQRLESFSV